MSSRVVEALETVDVDHENADGLMRFACSPPGMIESLVEEAAVRQASEGVGVGKFLELTVGPRKLLRVEAFPLAEEVGPAVAAILVKAKTEGKESKDGPAGDHTAALRGWRAAEGSEEDRKVDGKADERDCGCVTNAQRQNQVGDEDLQQQGCAVDVGESRRNVQDHPGLAEHGNNDWKAYREPLRPVRQSEAHNSRAKKAGRHDKAEADTQAV